jgi:hypothetical protein
MAVVVPWPRARTCTRKIASARLRTSSAVRCPTSERRDVLDHGRDLTAMETCWSRERWGWRRPSRRWGGAGTWGSGAHVQGAEIDVGCEEATGYQQRGGLGEQEYRGELATTAEADSGLWPPGPRPGAQVQKNFRRARV